MVNIESKSLHLFNPEDFILSRTIFFVSLIIYQLIGAVGVENKLSLSFTPFCYKPFDFRTGSDD